MSGALLVVNIYYWEFANVGRFVAQYQLQTPLLVARYVGNKRDIRGISIVHTLPSTFVGFILIPQGANCGVQNACLYIKIRTICHITFGGGGDLHLTVCNQDWPRYNKFPTHACV